MNNSFEKWKEDYALTVEPNYSEATEADCVAAFKAGYSLGSDLTRVFACFRHNKYVDGGYELYKIVSDRAKAEEWYNAEPYKHWYEEMSVE